MQYMILIHAEPRETPRPGGPGFAEYMAPWRGYNRAHTESGALLAGGQLQPAETATTIRRPFGGSDSIVDGPFAETKEQFGGYYIVEASDLDAALAIAAGMPLPAGSLEVRPMLRTMQV